jgi:protease-4
VDTIQASAEGRIFAGAEAKERKLVDELGGFRDAVKLAAKLAELPDDAPIQVVTDAPNIVDLLEGGDANDEDAHAAATAAAAAAAEELNPLAVPLRELVQRAPELAGLAAAMTPLFEGERTLAALPFGLSVR